MTMAYNRDALAHYVGKAQLAALRQGYNGEEGVFFADKMREYVERIKAMPQTYAQDGLGAAALVHLHYFSGASDWYITEKDSDPDAEGQIQAFGLADLFHDGGELGYISIKELIEANVELDLHWSVKTLEAVRGAYKLDEGDEGD